MSVNPYSYKRTEYASDTLIQSVLANRRNPVDELIRLETQAENEILDEGMKPTYEAVKERLDVLFRAWC